jgi:hypothetical protein
MKLFLVLLTLAGAYVFALSSVTDTALGQIQQINSTYQYVAGNAGELAGNPAADE